MANAKRPFLGVKIKGLSNIFEVKNQYIYVVIARRAQSSRVTKGELKPEFESRDFIMCAEPVARYKKLFSRISRLGTNPA